MCALVVYNRDTRGAKTMTRSLCNESSRYFAAFRYLPHRPELERRRLAQVALPPLKSRVVGHLGDGGDTCDNELLGERHLFNSDYLEGATERASIRRRDVCDAGKESAVEVQALRPLRVEGRAQGRDGHGRCSGLLQVMNVNTRAQ